MQRINANHCSACGNTDIEDVNEDTDCCGADAIDMDTANAVAAGPYYSGQATTVRALGCNEANCQHD